MTAHGWLRIGVAVVAAGLLAGLAASVLIWLLDLVQFAAYGVDADSLMLDVEQASAVRRVLAPTIGGLLAGLGWWALARRGDLLSVDDLQAAMPAKTPLLRPLADGVLQTAVVGAGASIGREGAPRLVAAALAARLATRLELDASAARIIVAGAAGAGLAAVYNVPLAGAIFGVALTRQWRSSRTWASCLAMSFMAILVVWSISGNEPSYLLPPASFDLVTAGWAVLAIPLCALTGIGFHLLSAHATSFALRSRLRSAPLWPAWTIAVAGALTGAASMWLPVLPGNGKDILQAAFDASAPMELFVVLLVAKPVATAMYLAAGARGGLLTPALSTGAALGVAAAWGLSLLGIVADPVPFAIIAAGGVLAVTQRAPLFAAVMAWELIRAPIWILPLLLVAAFGSCAVTSGTMKE